MSAATQRANKATADDLAASIPQTHTIHDKTLSFTLKTASDMGEPQRDEIWRIFEENIYHASSFGWDPQRKKREMFDPQSRFVMAHDAHHLVAYAIFRFEREGRQNVVYCYELQVSTDCRRFGLGRLLVQMLSHIGAQWAMTKLMLTVFKANDTAMLFYESIGFTTDETSPDDAEGECDYAILSVPCLHLFT